MKPTLGSCGYSESGYLKPVSTRITFCSGPAVRCLPLSHFITPAYISGKHLSTKTYLDQRMRTVYPSASPGRHRSGCRTNNTAQRRISILFVDDLNNARLKEELRQLHCAMATFLAKIYAHWYGQYSAQEASSQLIGQHRQLPAIGLISTTRHNLER